MHLIFFLFTVYFSLWPTTDVPPMFFFFFSLNYSIDKWKETYYYFYYYYFYRRRKSTSGEIGMNQNAQTFYNDDGNNANDDIYLRNAALTENTDCPLCYLTRRYQ